jgi:hypothetical protein
MKTKTEDDAAASLQQTSTEYDNFTEFARRIFSVPKEEFDKELAEVEKGKPLKHDLSKNSKVGRPRNGTNGHCPKK